MSTSFDTDLKHALGFVDRHPTREAMTLALRSVLEGRLAVLTVDGFMNFIAPGAASPEPPPEGFAAMFWWRRHPKGEAPVLLVVDSPSLRLLYWEAPNHWSATWCDRYSRDCEAFDRQMNRGEQGKVLKHFYLGDSKLVLEFCQGSISAYEKQAD